MGAPTAACWALLLAIHTGWAIPSITPAQNTLTVKSGQEILLLCRDSTPVNWIFQRPGPSRKPKIVQSRLDSGNGYKQELLIARPHAKETGRYTCINKETLSNVSIYVFVKDNQTPFLSSLSTMVDGVEGSDIVVMCPANDPDILNFTLRRCDDTNIDEAMMFVADIQQGITLKNVRKSFEGCYVCSAIQNGQLKKSQQFILTVKPVHKVIPTLLLSKYHQLLKQGEKFEVICTIRDVFSTVDGSWKDHPNMQVESRSKYRADSFYELNLTLSKTSLEVGDSGNFTCQALNSIGTASASIILEVLDKGFIYLSPAENATIEVNAGKNLVLRVEYEAYPKPEEEFWTYMNETLLNTSDHFVRLRDEGDNRYIGELHLIRLKGAERGIYTYRVANTDANTFVVFKILVKTKPEILRSERLDNGMLQCVAAGFPTPTIDWYFCPGTEQGCTDYPAITPVDVKHHSENSTFSSFDGLVVESTIDVGSLKKNGTVQCIASNTVESTASVFSFAIEDGNMDLGGAADAGPFGNGTVAPAPGVEDEQQRAKRGRKGKKVAKVVVSSSGLPKPTPQCCHWGKQPTLAAPAAVRTRARHPRLRHQARRQRRVSTRARLTGLEATLERLETLAKVVVDMQARINNRLEHLEAIVGRLEERVEISFLRGSRQ